MELKKSIKGALYDKKWDDWENAQLSFTNSPSVKGKTVVLIDDLYQSGITMNYIAMKLQLGGARHIYGLGLTKTLRNADNCQGMQVMSADSSKTDIGPPIRIDPIRIDQNDQRYPKHVRRIMGRQAPQYLDMMGNLDLLHKPGIGFCGSRKASLRGLEAAQDCAEQTAGEGISVISGHAAGVDCEVHRSSLQAGGNTILVLPEGINHFRIKKALRPVWDWDRVLVISQFKPDEPWKIYRAMTRNRLIIALSQAMILIEAGDRGGTFNAGKTTLELGLPLFVVQYEDMPHYEGNYILTKEGGQELKKRRSTCKASLSKVFAIIGDNKVSNSLPRQENLIASVKETHKQRWSM